MLHFMGVCSITKGRLANDDVMSLNSSGQVTMADESSGNDTTSTTKGYRKPPKSVTFKLTSVVWSTRKNDGERLH